MRRPALQVGRKIRPGYETSSTESPAMEDLTRCVVGVDLGDRKSLACVYTQGRVVGWFEFAMTPEGVAGAFEGKGYARVALEAGAQSGWVGRQLKSLGYEVVVANPRKLKAISANERKSDRNDAQMLAKLLWADVSLLHPIQPRSEERVLALSVLKARDAAVVGRARLINTVRAMAKSLGVRLQRGSAEGFVLREAEVPDELAPAVAGLFAVLRTLNEQIAAYDDQLKQMVKVTFPEAQRLCQVHGVGPVTALAFVLTLEDPARFPNGRTAAAFLGLVPRRDQSGAIDRQLRISKTGSNLVRRLLVQCAQYILGPLGRDCDLRMWGHALISRGGKSAAKRAIVAAARKLAVLLFRLWKTGEAWIPFYNAIPGITTNDASEGRPEPAISDDCASCLEDKGNPVLRGIDCSAADGSDPIMHQAQTGLPTSADRSVGSGTTSGTSASRTAKKRPPSPRTTSPTPTSAERAPLVGASNHGDDGKDIRPPRNPRAQTRKKTEAPHAESP